MGETTLIIYVAVGAFAYGVVAAGVYSAAISVQEGGANKFAAALVAIVWPIILLYRLGYRIINL